MSRYAVDHISATEPDWSREEGPGHDKRLVRAFRRYQHWRARPGPLAALLRRRWALSHRFWSVVTQAELQLNCEIGGGLRIPHPNGIVIHPDAVIGPNATIMSQVTIGTDRRGGAPRIGGHVDIGAGARILGPIRIGDHVQIGANAVVTRDVPDRMVAVGIPAKARPAPTDEAD